MPQQLRLFEEEPQPDTPEAVVMTPEFELVYQRFNEDMNSIRFTILVWGPSLRSNSKVAHKRREIYSTLKDVYKHKAMFSEQLPLPAGASLKSFELAQAREADMIVLLVEADAPGAIGEMHDFCSHKELLQKILLFFPETMRHSYNGGGIVKDLDKGFRNVEWYKEIDVTSCKVRTTVLEWVQARRSYEYSNGKAPARSGG